MSLEISSPESAGIIIKAFAVLNCLKSWLGIEIEEIDIFRNADANSIGSPDIFEPV